MPEISVIVPVYKVEPYLRTCVDSILAQTFTDFELILVDDGSPDNCGAICDAYAANDNRVRVIHQENQGQAAARNRALDWIFENSDSEYVSFIDSDDWVHERFLELLLRGIKRFDVRICQCRFMETAEAQPSTELTERIVSISPQEQYSSYYSAFMWDKLFARSCWEKMRFPEGQIYEDVAIWYKMLCNEDKLSLVDDVLYYYYINLNSTVHTDWTPKKLARMDAWNKQLDYVSHHGSQVFFYDVLRRYFWVFKLQYREVGDSSLITDAEKKTYHLILKDQMKHVLRQYRRELFACGMYWRVFVWTYLLDDRSYHRLSDVYRKLRGI